ncbi:MAG: hypothetical protein ACKPKO_55375, partial [Candidatus Fonsibacter sp.]
SNLGSFFPHNWSPWLQRWDRKANSISSETEASPYRLRIRGCSVQHRTACGGGKARVGSTCCLRTGGRQAQATGYDNQTQAVG